MKDEDRYDHGQTYTLIESAVRYKMSWDAMTTLMAHGALRHATDGNYWLATEEDMLRDPGSVGVNHNKPGAVLAALRTALTISVARASRWEHRNGGKYVELGRAIWIDARTAGVDGMEIILLEGSPGVWTAENAVPVEGYLQGHLQTAAAVTIGFELVVYRSEKDQSLWARPTAEFMDGRFSELPPNDSFEELTKAALKSVEQLDDWTNKNETDFTGWGDGVVPPTAEFWRVKSGQALRALKELPAGAAFAPVGRL